LSNNASDENDLETFEDKQTKLIIKRLLSLLASLTKQCKTRVRVTVEMTWKITSKKLLRKMNVITSNKKFSSKKCFDQKTFRTKKDLQQKSFKFIEKNSLQQKALENLFWTKSFRINSFWNKLFWTKWF
jgi:hypothetical protein